ncbi:uncharacterized protein [Panulirus ornatus]|uniref:uncharacterized protein n=1 Tax=Panulirus ornatus TaxID=150431 RepID=UPI003A8B5610
MCKQSYWTLSISWMAACTVVSLIMETKVHALVKMDPASNKGLVATGIPTATAYDSSLPTLLALTHADPQDRSITADPKVTNTGLRSVGWAGVGDIPNNLWQPSSLSLPKWVPDYQPVKEKHWDAIKQALNSANAQNSKSKDYHKQATANPAILTSPLPGTSNNEWLPTNISSLEILLHNTALHIKPMANETKLMEDFTERYDSNYNTPTIQSWKAFPDESHDSLLAPTFLNPLEVYLPDHVRYASQQIHQPRKTQNQKIIKVPHEESRHYYSQPSYTSISRKPRPPNYIPWPNVRQDTMPDHISHVKSVPLPQSQEPPVSTNLFGKNHRIQNPLMNSKVFLPQANHTKQVPQSIEYSNESDLLGLNKPMSHTAPVNQKYKQWPHTNEGNSQPQFQQSSNTEKSDFNGKKPLNSSYDEFIKHISQISEAQVGTSSSLRNAKYSLPVTIMRDSKMKPSTDSVKQSPELHHDQRASNHQELQNKQKAMIQGALLPLEAMVSLPENQDFREKQEANVYTQPWLHALVQNDLKNWGFPYDKEALQHLPSGYHHSQLPPSRKHKIDNDDFHNNLSEKVNNKKSIHTSLSPKVNAYHLAVVEAPYKPNNVPLPIRNVHVIAPTPDNVPPMPLFRPAETQSIQFPPYVVNGPLSRTPGHTKENPMLVIPHPAREFDPHERSSNLYPVMVPLKQASQRQDINPLHMIMQPIREIFNLRNPSDNSRDKKPLPPKQIVQKQRFGPLMQLSPPPEAPKRNKSQSESPIHIEFPGFGPPKGEDVVTMPNDSEQKPITLQVTQSPFPSQHSHLQNAQKESTSSGEPQAQSIVSTVPQNQSFNLGKLNEQDATTTAAPHVPQDDLQQSLQKQSTNSKPPRQIQNENTKHSSNTHEQFHPDQLSNDEVLPPVENSATITQPTPTNGPVFIPWPNIQTSNTAAPFTAHDTSSVNVSLPQVQTPSQQNSPFFNRPSNIRPFRFPSFPSMDFLNPFTLFRGRENPQRKNTFPFFPSFFSEADNEPSHSMTETKYETPPSWPNTKTQDSGHNQQSNSASNFETNNISNINFLGKITSSTEKNNATFNFMPHLEPIFKNADKQPALENNPTTTHFNSKPSNQSSSGIHPTAYSTPEIQHSANTRQPSNIYPLNQNDPNIQSFFNPYSLSSPMDQMHNSHYKHPADMTMPHYFSETEPQHSFESFQESKVNKSPPKNLKNSYLENIYPISKDFAHSSYAAAPRNQVAKINPLPNRAHPTSPESQLNQNENLGLELIRFTIDDVISVPNLDIHTDQIPKITHSSTTTESHKLIAEDDMDSSPSEKMVKVTEFVVQQPNIPNTLNHRIMPNSTATILSPTKLTKLPNVLQRASTMSEPSTPQMESTNQPYTQLNISNQTPKILLNNTHLSNSLSNSTATYKPSTNHTTNTNRLSFFPNNWGITHPQSNNTRADKTNNTTSSNLSSAGSSRVTIIEATPMPKIGEIFPTLKPFRPFRKFTSQFPPLTTITHTTAASIMPSTFTPITPKAEKFDKDLVTQMQTTSTTPKIRSATRPLPPNFTKVRKSLEILMPGRWNHRTISKPPQIESDSLTKNTNISNSKGLTTTHNQFKLRYIAPPRKVHMNRPTPKPNLITRNTSYISTATPITASNGTLQSDPFIFPTTAHVNITTELPTTTSSMKAKNVELMRNPSANMKGNIHENEKEKEDGVEETLTRTPQYLETTTQTTYSTPETNGPSQSGSTSRYNSIQRLRNFMANKRRNRTHSTSKTAVLPTNSTLLMPLQIKTFKPTVSASAQPRITSPKRHNVRLPPANRKTTPLTTKPTTAPITTTTTKLSLHVLKITTPQSTVGLMDNDHKHTSSGSSTHEWELLQNHPELLEFHNWESSRLDATKNINNTQYSPEDQEHSHEGS